MGNGMGWVPPTPAGSTLVTIEAANGGCEDVDLIASTTTLAEVSIMLETDALELAYNICLLQGLVKAGLLPLSPPLGQNAHRTPTGFS